MDTQRRTEMLIAIRMSSRLSTGKLPMVVLDESQETHERSNDPELDTIVRQCGLGGVLHIEQDLPGARIAELVRMSPSLPAIIHPKSGGLAACAASRGEALRMLECVRLKRAYEPLHMPGPGRLRGCIAAITGSAQGFGKGIAEELAAEGASVVIADLNDSLGNKCAEELSSKFGAGCAVFVHTDVTSLESLQQLAQSTVCAFGGIDMFVSNAGVLKAGGIHEMDEKTFTFVTDVNYTGYFLGVKAVAPSMKLQNARNKSHFMDIVQINSKSGLVGSNKNFAYAGSKFGGVGLTQSFALELVEHNIKVNTICPGNYYEGPLWSDPEKGLFVQYLATGKVPGAKTIDEVRKFYTDKVPMKRGCSPRDVAKAIFYVFEQEYETGQAIPVTGGQVMLA